MRLNENSCLLPLATYCLASKIRAEYALDIMPGREGDPQGGRKLDGLQAAIGEFNVFLLSEPGGSGARLKKAARALLPSLVVKGRGVDHEFEVRALRIAIWPDSERFHGSIFVAILLPFFQGN